ncbi:MAG TPA: hypothetical protein VMD78_16795 [Candidatus Baltobacteraceae bacterium]|nr:hypothetical protein [Candidatus Baltobacteraceae bacterium]
MTASRKPSHKPRPRGGALFRRPHLRRIAALALLAIALLFAAAPHALGQGCAMCYQNAASSGAAGRAALRHGILILLVPALSLFLGVFFLISRRDPS